MSEKKKTPGGANARIPEDIRTKALADVAAGMRISEVARKYSVSAGAVGYWNKVSFKQKPKPARGGNGVRPPTNSRLLMSMAKTVKLAVMEKIREGSDAGAFETDVLTLCNTILSGFD